MIGQLCTKVLMKLLSITQFRNCRFEIGFAASKQKEHAYTMLSSIVIRIQQGGFVGGFTNGILYLALDNIIFVLEEILEACIRLRDYSVNTSVQQQQHKLTPECQDVNSGGHSSMQVTRAKWVPMLEIPMPRGEMLICAPHQQSPAHNFSWHNLPSVNLPITTKSNHFFRGTDVTWKT